MKLILAIVCLALLSACETAAVAAPLPSNSPNINATLSAAQIQATQAAHAQATDNQADADRRATAQAAPKATEEHWRQVTATGQYIASATKGAVEIQVTNNASTAQALELQAQGLQSTRQALEIVAQQTSAAGQATLDAALQGPQLTAQVRRLDNETAALDMRMLLVNGLICGIGLTFLSAVLIFLYAVYNAWIVYLQIRKFQAGVTTVEAESETQEQEGQAEHEKAPPAQSTLKAKAQALVFASIRQGGEIGDTLIGLPGRDGQDIRDALVAIGWIEVRPGMPTRVAGGHTLDNLKDIIDQLDDQLKPPPPLGEGS